MNHFLDMNPQLLNTKCQSLPTRIISTRCEILQLPRSTSQMEFPMLLREHSQCPNLGCSFPAQSSQHRFGEAPPFARGLVCSFASLPDFVSKRRQTHLKIPNGGGASPNAAMNGGIFWIRIYSCLEPDGYYVQL